MMSALSYAYSIYTVRY